jgi:hypothetical protein
MTEQRKEDGSAPSTAAVSEQPYLLALVGADINDNDS